MKPASSPTGWTELSLGDHIIAESPRWDPRTSELLWVDVFGGTLGRATHNAVQGSWTAAEHWPVGAPLTSVAPLRDADRGWIVATGTGLARVARDGNVSPLCELVPPADYPAIRTNDMVTDRAGRLLVGLLEESRSVRRAALLRVDPDGRTAMLVPDLIAANGVGLSPDESVLYLVDSVPRTLTAYPYDASAGRAGPGTVLATWSGTGTFDGLAVDSSGDIWVAVWDEGIVCRLSPSGVLDATVSAPVTRPTALAFAGPGEDQLVLTTARQDLRPPQPGKALPPLTAGRLHVQSSSRYGTAAAPCGFGNASTS